MNSVSSIVDDNNTLNINALYYYKNNIHEIISQFCINRKKYNY